jgi:hypothetical protein
MLRSTRHLIHFEIEATDGHLGHVHDLYYDDQSWKIRYVVVSVNHWIPSRYAMIVPDVVERIDWNRRALGVELTRDQVKNSPDVSTDMPVALQYLTPIHEYYGWPFWEGLDVVAARLAHPSEPKRDPHLRSVHELRGYRLLETDGELGHLDDHVFDDEDWRIRYLVIEYRRWFHTRRALISPEWVLEIDWISRHIRVDLSREKVQNSPAYDPRRPLPDRGFEHAPR